LDRPEPLSQLAEVEPIAICSPETSAHRVWAMVTDPMSAEVTRHFRVAYLVEQFD
jgi:hypothetical protein